MKLVLGILMNFLSFADVSAVGRTKKLPAGIDFLLNSRQGPEDQFTPHFFNWVGANSGQVSNIFSKHIPENQQKSFESLSSPNSQDARCDGCILAVELIKLVINLGLEYEDIEAIAIEVCEVVVSSDGYRGDILCPGIVQNYGPHLFTIFGETTQDGLNICTMYGYCIDEAKWIEAENTYFPFFPKKKQPASGQHFLNSMFSKAMSKLFDFSTEKRVNSLSSADAAQMIDNARKRMAEMGLLEEHDKLYHSTESFNRYSKGQHHPRKRRQAEDVIRIAFFSDAHIETEYLEGTATECGMPLCCRGEANGTGSAASYGDWSCNVPPSTIEMWLQHVAALQPDMVLYTGDTPANSLWAETVDRQHNVTRWLAEKIAEYMPGVPAFTTIGNHESYPANLYFAPRPQIQQLHQVIADSWGVLSGWEEEQITTFYDAGYYTQLIRPGLRILAWNTNYGFGDNWYNILNQDQPELERMKTFVEETLIAAEENNEKVIVLTHHPSGGLSYFGDWDTNIMLNHSSVVIMRATGHTHGDGFKVFLDPTTGVAQSVQLTGPTSNTYSGMNPGVRLFYLDAETFELLDYDQYFFYLGNRQDGMVDEPEIALMYTASQEYEMTNMSAASFLDLVHRMEENDEVFDRYYANKRMRTITDDCSGDCKTNELCGLTAPSCNAYLACVLYTLGVDIDTPAPAMYSTGSLAAWSTLGLFFSFIVALAVRK